MRPTLFLFAALIFAGAAATPALAGPKRARTPQVKKRGIDLYTQHRLDEARRERDHRLGKLDRQMEYEKRRARSKYRHDPYALKAAIRRLKGWYDRTETRIRRDFKNRRDRILAESRRSPVKRDLALARARRDRALRDIAVQEEFEYRRARNKFRGYELRAAKERLRIHFKRKRAQVERRFEREKAEILGCGPRHIRGPRFARRRFRI